MNEATAKDSSPPGPLDADSDVDAHADAHPALTPSPIQVGGKDFVVKPMKVRQVFPFLKLARPMLTALTRKPPSPTPGLPPADAGSDQGGSSIHAEMMANLADAEWMLQTFEDHGPNIIKALAIGLDAKEDDIGELEVVDLIVLVKHFIVVNASFFTARGLALPPNLSVLQGAAVHAGPPSQASS